MPLLELCQLHKTFQRRGGEPPLRAVDDVSLSVEPGECVALVGESGSGKSTLGRLALRLLLPDSGRVLLEGQDITRLSGPDLHRMRMTMQPVFQDPSAAFNPRRTVRGLLHQALVQADKRDNSDAQLCDLLEQVELHPAKEFLQRYPSELSGGQRQRLAIARALATEPRLIIADEPLSGADVSIRAQVLDLLTSLQVRSGVAFLLITHDMLLARAVSNRLAVMYRGRIVEAGQTDTVLDSPTHPYTQRLLAAVQSVDLI